MNETDMPKCMLDLRYNVEDERLRGRVADAFAHYGLTEVAEEIRSWTPADRAVGKAACAKVLPLIKAIVPANGKINVEEDAVDFDSGAALTRVEIVFETAYTKDFRRQVFDIINENLTEKERGRFRYTICVDPDAFLPEAGKT